MRGMQSEFVELVEAQGVMRREVIQAKESLASALNGTEHMSRCAHPCRPFPTHRNLSA